MKEGSRPTGQHTGESEEEGTCWNLALRVLAGDDELSWPWMDSPSPEDDLTGAVRMAGFLRGLPQGLGEPPVTW